MESTPTGLPLQWHDDGIPIFERSDIVRGPRPLLPDKKAVIYDELMLPEHRHLRPELKYNMIVISNNEGEIGNQAWLGKSYLDDRRNIHFGRVIQALDANSRVILQRWEKPGKITDFVILSMKPLYLAVVPPTYECILVNISSKHPARFFELQAREEKRNIDTIEEYNGPGYLVSSNGELQYNANYDELPIPRIHPGLQSFRFLQQRPLYEMLTQYPKGFDFIDPPRDDFYAGAV